MEVRFSDNDVNIMRTALDKWGFNAQAGCAVEECAELIVALQKYVNRSPGPEMIENILDEITDVEIMMAQMRLALGIDDDALRKRIAYKFERINRRLTEG